MSFSADAKAELCRIPLNKSCCAVAEAYGVLLFSYEFSAMAIRIITGSAPFARRLPRLMKKAFGIDFDSRADGAKSTFAVTDPEKIRRVFSAFGYDADSALVSHVNFGVLEEDCCRAAFVRGAFLAGGSITDPSKRCHLELVTDHKNVAGETVSVLQEMGFSPRVTLRAGHQVIYLKQSEAAEDFFTTIGATGAAMELMSAKVEKEMRNAINRQINCDSANADKIVSAATAQMERIRALERDVGLENLPRDLSELALLRIANPEASLSDLAKLSDPPVSKSCINHRLRKLMSYRPESEKYYD
ncbi:MAG: DNA-binding protein WhiA [Ruminococcaceae bacterium]|nr:DNA-binding protein WhiA [Oscillospiraceae bacterium]